MFENQILHMKSAHPRSFGTAMLIAHCSLRGHASLVKICSSRSPASSLSKKKTGRVSAALSLDRFLQRQRVLSLWREILRATNQIQSKNTRCEMRNFAREEFERHRLVEDLTQIRYLVSTGREQKNTMQRYVNEMVA